MKNKVQLVGLAIVVASAAFAQNPPWNMSARWNYKVQGDRYAEIWGDGNFLYCGHYGQNKVDIIDVTDPSNPVPAAIYYVGSPDQNCSAQDVTARNGMLFIGFEESGVNDAEIVDVRDPYHPVLKRKINVPDITYVHDLFYQNGWLYLVDSRQEKVVIIDLRSFDITAPAGPTITQAKWVLNTHTEHDDGGGDFVHDITVAGNRLWVAAWDAGLKLYDISNIANQPPVFKAKAPGQSVHSCWQTDDGQYVVTAEEHIFGGLRLFEVVESETGTSLVIRQTYGRPQTDALCVHNPLFVGDRLFCSWYQLGVLVLDLNRQTKQLQPVANYDTYPFTTSGVFDGCWSVYPFLGQDRILAGDLATGIWVLAMNETMTTAVNGVVQLEEYYGGAGRTATLEFRIPGTLTIAYNSVITRDAFGKYAFVGAPTGTFDISVKFSNWLRQTKTNFAVTFPSTVIDFSLMNGDADDDNLVGIPDLNAVLVNFGGTGGGEGDIDWDKLVSLQDLNNIVTNFAIAGDQ